MEMDTERSMELRKEIRKFVEENPELAAQMLKVWLRGGEENG
jgi:flagellar M-ring protein FliF